MSEITELIIISDQVKEFLPREINSNQRIINAGNIYDEVKSSLLNDNVNLLQAVMFITGNEFKEIIGLLEQSDKDRVFYTTVIFGSDGDLSGIDEEKLPLISEFRKTKISDTDFNYIVNKSFSLIKKFHYESKILKECTSRLSDIKQDQEDLINIGKSLSSEKDPDQLLTLILFLSKKITGADAGSIYLVELDENGKKRLRFKYSHTFSRDIPLEEFIMEMNKKSIAGYVAVTGEVLNISNVYDLPANSSFSFNSSFDEQNNYKCKSMLVVPMRNHTDQIIGVIQLINSKEDLTGKGCSGNEAFSIILEKPEDFEKYLVSFNPKYDSLLEAIAGQAAVAIENNRMIKQIQNQFKEFVRASVTAIESRDPATSGHSFRVAEICKLIAYCVNSVKDGYLKDYNFDNTAIQELEFAALLHDFGKVYIDNSIFMKEKKLFPKDFENLLIRIDYLYRYAEVKYSEEKWRLVMEGKDFEKIKVDLLKIENDKAGILDKIKKIKDMIVVLNEPTVLDRDPEEAMKEIMDEIKDLACHDINNNIMNIITDHDRINLTIRRGSLNPMERKEIETHVRHTYNFVSMIPWPPEYKNIPEIALRHHEAIDGSGYPDKIKGRESMSLQSRMVSIADVFDALTAHDRPYKKAVPLEKVLKILREEAERGKLDKDLVELFIIEKIYEKV